MLRMNIAENLIFKIFVFEIKKNSFSSEVNGSN